MITSYYIESQSDGSFWCGIKTDFGGDQDYGSYDSQAEARHMLRFIVENDFDEEWDESKLETREGP